MESMNAKTVFKNRAWLLVCPNEGDQLKGPEFLVFWAAYIYAGSIDLTYFGLRPGSEEFNKMRVTLIRHMIRRIIFRAVSQYISHIEERGSFHFLRMLFFIDGVFENLSNECIEIHTLEEVNDRIEELKQIDFPRLVIACQDVVADVYAELDENSDDDFEIEKQDSPLDEEEYQFNLHASEIEEELDFEREEEEEEGEHWTLYDNSDPSQQFKSYECQQTLSPAFDMSGSTYDGSDVIEMDHEADLVSRFSQL